MPDESTQYFYRVKRGKVLRDPKTGETLATGGQLVPQEHRDLDPRVCLGPESGASPSSCMESGIESGAAGTESPAAPGSSDDDFYEDDEDEAEG